MNREQISDYLLNRITDKLTEFYVSDKGVSLEDALNAVYNSDIYSKLKLKDDFLLSQSPSYIYSIFISE